MPNELQSLVDSLSRRLNRAVAVDDRQFRILAYSRHVGQVDDVRRASILARQPPEEARRYVSSLRIAEAEGIVRVPAKPELGMDARVVAPIRSQGTHLGYLWLIDADESLPDDEAPAVQAAADAVGLLLYRDQLVTELELGRERELLRDLLAEEADLRRHAAERLVEAELFVPATKLVALVVTPVVEPGAEVDETVRMALGAGLERVRRTLSPRHRLHLVRPDHALLVVALSDPALPVGDLDGLADMALRFLESAMEHVQGPPVVVGVGSPQSGLTEAVLSYREALHAARVGTIVRSYGNTVQWSRLGIYRVLSQIPTDQLSSDIVHPGLNRLLEANRSRELVTTLETYLDLACDAKETAAALCLHRASLYYRLHKVEEIVGASLRNGEDRLALHLGLKLARMVGIHPDDDPSR